MEAYTYSNLFDTKGIEYIIIIFFLLLLIPFWIIINRKSEVADKIRNSIKALTVGSLRIPKGLFFSRNHTWLQLEKSGDARIGIDDFLLKVLGDVRIEPLKVTGEKIRKGDVIALLEQEGKQLKLHAPVSGQISGFNEELVGNTSTLARDPYGEGWLFKVEPDNWKTETTGYTLGKESLNWMDRELQRLKDFLSISFSKNNDLHLAPVFQEGGELQMNPLAGLETKVWDDFQYEFLEQTE